MSTFGGLPETRQKPTVSLNFAQTQCASSNQVVGVRIRPGALIDDGGSPGHEIGNEQIESLTDNKAVRLPGAAPGWTSPLQRRRSGAKRRTSGGSREQSDRAHL